MKAFAALFLGFISFAQAATIAVIDSGVDPSHTELKSKMWINPKPSTQGPFAGAKHGWNFAENNSQIFDPAPLFLLDPDVKKVIELQAQSFLFSVSDADKAWVQDKMKSKTFQKQLDFYGNYVHGTHVAGISSKSSKNKIMAIKLLASSLTTIEVSESSNKSVSDPWALMKLVFESLSNDQTKGLNNIARFVNANKVDVANGSFGTGVEQMIELSYVVFVSVMKREPTKAELIRSVKLGLNTLVSSNRFAELAPNTLWVFAAGNESSNNDEWGFSPANYKAANTISVAATYKDQFLAPFSNYGVKMVDVAAPGMAIKSTIPGNDYLTISGTSQAAPYVSNIAGQVKDMNPKLRPEDIKKIIMETVDVKPFLVGKVSTGGLVNMQRAIVAAQLSTKVSLAEAITRAHAQVGTPKSREESDDVLSNVEPIKMPALFELNF